MGSRKGREEWWMYVSTQLGRVNNDHSPKFAAHFLPFLFLTKSNSFGIDNEKTRNEWPKMGLDLTTISRSSSWIMTTIKVVRVEMLVVVFGIRLQIAGEMPLCYFSGAPTLPLYILPFHNRK